MLYSNTVSEEKKDFALENSGVVQTICHLHREKIMLEWLAP